MSYDTATGPDEIHYEMLKHVPPLEKGFYIFSITYGQLEFILKAGVWLQLYQY